MPSESNFVLFLYILMISKIKDETIVAKLKELKLRRFEMDWRNKAHQKSAETIILQNI